MDVGCINELALCGKKCSNPIEDRRLLRRVLPKIVVFLQNWTKMMKEWGIGLTPIRWLWWGQANANRIDLMLGYNDRFNIINRDVLYTIFTPMELVDYVPFHQIETSFPSSISTDETMTRWDDIGITSISKSDVSVDSTPELGGKTEEETEEELECCIICADELDSRYCAEMPCCGARIHTRCFTNCIANTIGTAAGNTREQCIFCRARICDPIKLDHIMAEKLISLRASADAGWEEAEDQADVLREHQEESHRLLQIEKGNFARLERLHIKLRVDYEFAVFESEQRRKTIKKLIRGIKGKGKLVKEKVAVQNALREEKRLRHEERYVRCMHIGCGHKPFKFGRNRQSRAFEDHVKGHLMRELMSSVSIESNIKLNLHVVKCQSLVRGYNTRKWGLYRFWKLLNSIN